ncbi:PHP domain-containing protein [Laceyella putida]|uniref:PHP domain-containing protein n=1 Tax=Laceyella putida TaxID=110101 RepID=A0ABW2RME8_9BACL
MNILNDLEPGTFDLHIHTRASDGIYSPTEIVEKAFTLGLQTIAITDHDTLEGVSEAVKASQHIPLSVIPGVEIRTRWRKRNVDLLGYNIKDSRRLQHNLRAIQLEREERARKIIEKFRQLNMPITLEDVKRQSQDGVITRPHIAKAIVAKGYLYSVRDVFYHYLGDGRPANIDLTGISLEEGITMIHDAGGVAVLAHPYYIKNPTHIEEMISLGLDGLEVWHREHRPRDVNKLIHLAEKHHLFVTGGSDFHHDAHQLGQFLM